MEDYTKTLPRHIEKCIGGNDLFLEIYEGEGDLELSERKPPLLFVHGAYTGSWMWSKFIAHFVNKGFTCYVMNMRSHYKSRVMDMTGISFEDYLDDIEMIIAECGVPPILIGFSMGGILCQKVAEKDKLAGLVLIDTSISMEVNKIAPYKELAENTLGIVMPAPAREERESIDESPEDIAFQKKYLSMESSKALGAMACWIKGNEGMSVDSSLITCPCLVICAVNSADDDRRGRATAEHLNAEYTGLWAATHTGLLVGQRYYEIVERMLKWLKVC